MAPLPADPAPQAVPTGTVTVSDRAFHGIHEEQGGPGIEAALARILATPWRAMRHLRSKGA